MKFDRGEEYEGTIGELDGNSATIHFDDGQNEKFKFPDPDVRVTSGNDVVVRCRALFGDDEVFEISEAAARHAARRRETAELQAQTAMRAQSARPALTRTHRAAQPVTIVPATPSRSRRART